MTIGNCAYWWPVTEFLERKLNCMEIICCARIMRVVQWSWCVCNTWHKIQIHDFAISLLNVPVLLTRTNQQSWNNIFSAIYLCSRISFFESKISPNTQHSVNCWHRQMRTESLNASASAHSRAQTPHEYTTEIHFMQNSIQYCIRF